ncbi:AAA domain-containing protein [Acidobacterium sp.]|nr:AAA domain-containing protein [Acidobacterium sp.]
MAAHSAKEKLVEAAKAGWIDRLIDTSRRNNLLFFRPVLGGSIEVETGNPDFLSLLNGETIHAISLLGESLDRPGRILNIARKAQENLEEKGLQTLYLGLGFAMWKAEDGGRDYRAPVFLIPLQFKRKGSEYNSVDVTVAAEATVNPVLLHILQQRFGVKIDTEELLPLPIEEVRTLTSDGVDPRRREADGEILASYLEKLRGLGTRLKDAPEFRTDASAVIGNFAFAKMAMVNDLKESGLLLAENQLIAAIAGDDTSRAQMASQQVDIDPRSLDKHRPDDQFCVVEADSSQQCAIDGIAAGQSAVVHGPPGTGKSQTITNLIATLVGLGKSVLFVAEKRAALEVVQQRLQRSRLGHLAIDLHGAELSSRRVMERVAETLAAVRHFGVPDCDALHQQFVERRSRLNRHVSRMHTVSPRSGMTLFEMYGKLLDLPPDSATNVRWRGAELEKLSPDTRGEISVLLKEFASLASLVTGTDRSPWTGMTFPDGASAQEAIDIAARFAREELPALRASLSQVRLAFGFDEPDTFDSAANLVRLLRSVSDHLERYSAEVYQADLDPLVQQLLRGSSRWKALWLSITSREYKDACLRVTAYRKGVRVSPRQLLRELQDLAQESIHWKEFAKGMSTPAKFSSLEDLETHYREARRQVESLQALRGAQWLTLNFDQLKAVVEPFAQDQATPYRLLKLAEIEKKLNIAGLQRLLSDIRNRKPAPEYWSSCFDCAWMNSAVDELAVHDSDVKGFVGNTHNEFVEDFRRLDSERLKIAVERVRRAHALRAVQAMNEHPAQEAMIKAEAAKVRRHKPLRTLFSEAWEVLTAVCPCWMASPLSVSQLIDRGARFDYVIFDEASQVLPEDAVPAIMRAKQIVVAGDNQQLPPTGFFASGLSEDDEIESAAAGFESLLDMMLPFAKPFHLNWHYRSRDEALIAFSNHHIYKDRLVTFPGPGGHATVAHVLVNHVPDADGQEESSAEEVRQVVQLVLQHARENPERTLGVISMGIKHAMRLQGALDLTLKDHPELAEFFDPDRPERFFIKNLERVQGDERDSIIISVGYGKNRAGDLPLRFGPILSAGGRRRLNVAVTRARETMTVVSSFSHLDIDATKVREGTGLEFLKNFLQYASSGGKLIAQNEVTSETMNEFEADIYTALEARGMKLVPQVGCSQFRIDFGVCHPEQPGRFILAIECDGATYHSSATARDRDRLRQQMLENLGWTFHRIWSTDWFLRREEEIERAWNAYQTAVRSADECGNGLRVPESDGNEEVLYDDGVINGRGRSEPVPPIPRRSNIGEYTSQELTRLYEWVLSDGVLRTHDEIADEMFRALPFSRRGARIEAVLRQTIASCDGSR